jgi:hypothetical protein
MNKTVKDGRDKRNSQMNLSRINISILSLLLDRIVGLRLYLISNQSYKPPPTPRLAPYLVLLFLLIAFIHLISILLVLVRRPGSGLGLGLGLVLIVVTLIVLISI